MAVLLGLSAIAHSQSSTPISERVEQNVVYGMYSGLALLMDVHHPANPNGSAVIYVDGSAWHARLSYDAVALKDRPALLAATNPLVQAGYTVFVINHRAAPRFRYPAAIEDAQRAIRFVRHYASRFGIRPTRIGAAGHSSGACLALLLGVLDGDPLVQGDLVDAESAKVQAVAALAAPTDFLNVPVSSVQASYLGVALMDRRETSSEEYRIHREASPVAHVTKDDAPSLLMHGDSDPVVPFLNAELMQQAMIDAGVATKLIRIRGGGHFPPFPAGEPDPFRESVEWFDKHLVIHDDAEAR